MKWERSKECILRQTKFSEAHLKPRWLLAAIKNERTIAELSSVFEVHPNLITKWKKELLASLPGIFDGRHSKKEDSLDIDGLYKEIGKLKIENEFLKKKYEQLLKM